MEDRQQSLSQLQDVLAQMAMPVGLTIRAWTEADFTGIQRLSDREGWTTPSKRPDDALRSWHQSWPALVAWEHQEMVGFFRALTDGYVTTYIADILVVPAWQQRGVGALFLELCHRLYPSTRFDLLSTEGARGF